jgi:copper chaperone
MQFVIPDMACGGCAKAVANAITRVDPTATLDIDMPAKIVSTTSTLPRQQLMEAIEAAGFHPSRET